MESKRRLLERSRLCAIIDKDLLKSGKVLDTARSALAGGADIIQLRAKSDSPAGTLRIAKSLERIAKRYGAAFIVNDMLDLAVAADADGLHVGEGDVDASLARRLMKDKKILGVSVKDYKGALKAKRMGADYVGVGPVFRTPIKKGDRPRGIGLVKKVKKLDMPYFAIGGIDREKAMVLAKNGIKKIAVIRAVCKTRDPYDSARRLKEVLA